MNFKLIKSGFAVVMFAITLLAAPVSAQPAEQAAISHAMKAIFDKPSDPLTVTPAVVQGQYAVAGWLQGGKGGRAVLQKVDGKWLINVCGGDRLKSADALAQTGMSADTAKLLAQRLAKAESQLGPDVIKKLAMFDGIINVQGGHGAHGSHEGHGADGAKGAHGDAHKSHAH